MMFEVFKSSFSRDARLSVEGTQKSTCSEVLECKELIDRFGGSSFERGLYRVIRGEDLDAWNARITFAFPEFGSRIDCFGFDWLGRVFAIDPKRLECGEPGVVMFEPGAGEALEIPCNVGKFHDEELIEYGEAALARDLHEQWLASGGAMPQYGQCIGYQKPLFLGGSDEVGNLGLFDIDVYWQIMGQLIVKAKGLPLNTPIGIRIR